MLSVSVTVVEHVLDSISFDLPETLCIDEFKGDSGEWDDQQKYWYGNRYHCNIVNGDGNKGYVMDILPQISADYVKAYFRQFPPAERQRVNTSAVTCITALFLLPARFFPKLTSASICFMSSSVSTKL